MNNPETVTLEAIQAQLVTLQDGSRNTWMTYYGYEYDNPTRRAVLGALADLDAVDAIGQIAAYLDQEGRSNAAF
ncbi:MAG: hypothetical protein JXB35_08075 [Anaerolineae bacterium]|nr:hypothetical protein [Anaerolineae bacterium]